MPHRNADAAPQGRPTDVAAPIFIMGAAQNGYDESVDLFARGGGAGAEHGVSDNAVPAALRRLVVREPN